MRRLVLAVLIAVLGGCAVYKPPVVEPFADAKYWVLKELLQYEVRNTGAVITVPAGFVTDFASIPSAFCVVLPKTGRYLAAAIMHDYLYWNQSCSREQADRILDIAMEESQVDFMTRRVIFAGVKAGGSTAWAANAKERSAGGIRLIPTPHLDIPVDKTWEEDQRMLIQRNVTDTSDRVDLRGACNAATPR